MDKKPMCLERVADELLSMCDDDALYYNVKTGEVDYCFGSDDDSDDYGEYEDEIDKQLEGEEFDDEYSKREARQEIYWDLFSQDENRIALPEKFDINEWKIMEAFAYDQDDEKIKNKLLNAIHGSGAFRKFRTVCDCFDITYDWYDYRVKYVVDNFLIDFCEDNKIPYYHQEKKKSN